MNPPDYIPSQGDIVYLDFDPSAGHEIQKRRPALVMSHKVMAAKSGFVFVCPITSTRRSSELEVEIKGSIITGVALSVQLRSMDFRERNIQFVETAAHQTVVQMSEKLQYLLGV